MSYDNSNSGAIFKNDRKTEDRQPDYTGTVNVNGVDMFCSGWIKVAGSNARNPGSKFLSLAFSAKTAAKPAPAKPASSPTFDDMDDDIPF